jgi:hypothetical protein
MKEKVYTKEMRELPGMVFGDQRKLPPETG